MNDGLVHLECAVKNYEWGKRGRNGEVSTLRSARGEETDSDEPHAELWIGTHPSAPSIVDHRHGTHARRPLANLLTDRPELLGKAASEFGGDLPFLLKVLSIEKALSIQSHPDKALAERLHSEKPYIYGDANHKPEMVVALSDFEALCGFCEHEELAEALRRVPELRDACGDDRADAYSKASLDDRLAELRKLFSSVASAPREKIEHATRSMCDRLESSKARGEKLADKEELILRLRTQHPHDVGLLIAWFMNHVRLEAGRAMVVSPNEPHAYVSGDAIEVMATSDNVARVGFTNKFKDVDVACSSLSYAQRKPSLAEAIRFERFPGLELYRPKFREFEIWRLSMRNGETATLPAPPGAMLMLVLGGGFDVSFENGSRGERAKCGDVFFVPSGTGMTARASTDDAEAWFAACNGMGFAR
jgi:mannose-6-phosphate isomerase